MKRTGYAGLLVASIALSMMISGHAAIVADWAANGTTNDGDSIWEDATANGNDLLFASDNSGDNNVTSTADVDLVGSAFSFPGIGGSPALGARTNGNGNAYFQGLTDITVDVWFQVDTTSQKTVLFTTGGVQKGLSLSYDNGNLLFLAKEGTNGADADVNLVGVIAADETSQFIRATVTIDENTTNDLVTLYVDGVEVASVAGNLFADVTGGNNTSIGSWGAQTGAWDQDGGGNPEDDQGTWDNNFLGDIQRVTIWDEAIVVPEPSSFLLLILGGMGLVLRRTKRTP